ncbi:MAG TPA: phage tail tape measure protein [Candidatus Limnocylindrales bacterium]|nr:phage tail tape measure protein [Candidatus Limnocylindrales bacterium]
MSATSQLQIIISARDLASAQLRDVGASARGMGQSLGIAGQTAAGVFAGNLLTDAVRGIGGALGGAVGQAVDFEHAMSAVAAVAGANSGQLAQLSQTALALGQDVTLAGVNATDAAAAMQELAAGGVSVTDVIGGAARGALLLASAGGLDFATAADIAANSMNAFGLKGQDVTHIADIFSAAANASSATVQDIGESMQYVGPIAANMGLSIDETTAALAELGSQGIKGEQAGTTLRSMFTALSAPTKAAQQVMEQYGLSFFDAQGHMLSLAGIAQELNSHLSGLTDQQRAFVLSTLFSNAALSGATVITNGGAAAIQNYLKQVDVAGSAADNGRIRNDNLAGSFQQLQSTVQTAAIAFGTGLIPALRGIVDTVTGVVNAAIPRIQAFGAVLGGILSAVGGPVLAIVAAVGAALGVLVALGGALTAGGIAAGFIATALATVGDFLLPLAPIVLGIVAAVGVLGVAWATNLGGIRTFAGELLDFARSAGTIVRALVTAFRTGDFNQAFGPIIEAVDRAFGSEAAGKVTLFVSGLLRFAQLGRDAVITFTEALRGDWFGGQTTSINGFVRTVGRLAQLGRDAVLTFVAALRGDWFGQNTASINVFVRGVGILGQSLRYVLDALRPLPGLIADGFRLITGGQVAGGLSGFQARVSAFVGNILHLLGDFAGRITAVWLEIGTRFVEWLTPLVPRLLTGIGQLFVRVVDFLRGEGTAEVGGAMSANMPNAFMAWVGPALGPFLAALGGYATTMLTWVRDTAPKVAAQLGTWARAFGDWVTGTAWPYLAPKLADLLTNIGTWITGTAIPVAGQKLTEWGQHFGDWITGTAVPVVEQQLPQWLDAITGFIDREGPQIDAIMGRLASKFWRWITDDVIPQLQRYYPVISTINDQLGQLLTAIWDRAGHNIGIALVRGILYSVIDLEDALDKSIPGWVKALIPGYTAPGNKRALYNAVASIFQFVPLVTPDMQQQFDQAVSKAVAQAQAQAPVPTPVQQTFQFTVNGVGIGAQDAAQQMYAYLQPKLAAASGRSGLK